MPKRYFASNKPRPRAKSVLVFIAILSLLALSRRSTPSSSAYTRLSPLPEQEPPHKCPSTKHRPLYIYAHLHKTGGNTLKRVFFAFARRNNLTLYHTCHRPLPSSLLTAWWFNRPYHEQSKSSNTSLDCNLDHLTSLPHPNRSDIDLIVGHQHHGVHKLFKHRVPRYFTFVRHPLYRKASHYLHFENARARNSSRSPSSSRNSSFTEYMLSQNCNYMTKHLATHSPTSELGLYFRARAIDADPYAARAAFMSARANLMRHFFFVGLHHRYAESVCVLFNILARACRYGSLDSRSVEHFSQKLYTSFMPNLRALDRLKDNVRGKTRDAVQSLPHDVRQRVLLVENLDLHLFHLAEALFEQQLNNYEQCKGVTTLSIDILD